MNEYVPNNRLKEYFENEEDGFDRDKFLFELKDLIDKHAENDPESGFKIFIELLAFVGANFQAAGRVDLFEHACKEVLNQIK